MRNKDFIYVLVATAAILIVPLAAMQFSDEWDWRPFDFVIIGTLLVGTGILIALASRKIKNLKQRAAVIIALLVTLLLTWAELAVGIIGTPFAGS